MYCDHALIVLIQCFKISFAYIERLPEVYEQGCVIELTAVEGFTALTCEQISSRQGRGAVIIKTVPVFYKFTVSLVVLLSDDQFFLLLLFLCRLDCKSGGFCAGGMRPNPKWNRESNLYSLKALV